MSRQGDDKTQFISELVSGAMKVEYLTRNHAKWIYNGRELSGYYKTLHVYAERNERWQLVAVQACP